MGLRDFAVGEAAENGQIVVFFKIVETQRLKTWEFTSGILWERPTCMVCNWTSVTCLVVDDYVWRYDDITIHILFILPPYLRYMLHNDTKILSNKYFNIWIHE